MRPGYLHPLSTLAMVLALFGAMPRALAQDDADQPADEATQEPEQPPPPPEDPAHVRAEINRIRQELAFEPSARECARVALRFFRVHPEALDSLRASARARALMPVLAAGYRFNDNRSSQADVQMLTDPHTNASDFHTQDNGFSVGASWDLREAIFNGDQVQIYSLVGVQRDIMLEVLRAYFARRQLLLISRLRPPDDPIAMTSLELRIEEFTATLDALTGEWFSRTIESRQAGHDAPAN